MIILTYSIDVFFLPGPSSATSQPSNITPTPSTTSGATTSAPNQPQQQQGSRLQQWKLASSDNEAEGLNKAPGPPPAASTNPNLQNTSNPLGLDSTWATSTDSSTWPTSISSSASTASTVPNVSAVLPSSQTDNRESKSQQQSPVLSAPSATAVNLNQTATSLINTTAQAASQSTTASTSSVSEKMSSQSSMSGTDTDDDDKNSLLENINPQMIDDMIEEFVPGKPWQGTNIKNPEDDPDITPGDCMQGTWDSMLSQGGIKSPSADAWAADLKTGSKPTWSSSNSDPSGWKAAAASAKSSTRTPPGFMNQAKPNWNQQMNRSVSWAPGEHRPNQQSKYRREQIFTVINHSCLFFLF